MNLLQALEAIDAQYRTHPQALDPAFQEAVIWPALHAADPGMPPTLHTRGRPGEEHDWPLLFWAAVSQRIEAHRQAEAWSRDQSAQQVILDWVKARQADAAHLHAAWTAQEAQERQVWGAPDANVYGPQHTRLAQGVRALDTFERAVRAGRFQPALARLQVWTSMANRATWPLVQPHEQLQAWLDDTTRVMRCLQEP